MRWLGLLLVAASRGEEVAYSALGREEPPSLTQTALHLLDKNKDAQVSLKEAGDMLDGLIALSSMGGEGGGGESEMATMGKQAKRWMPTLFKLLDSDRSGGLEEGEIEWVERGLEAAKKNLFRNLTRDMFEALDSNGDNSLDPAEVEAALQPEMYRRLISIAMELFPLPGLTAEFANGSPSLVKENLKEIVSALDGNGDGSIERKEAGAAVASFKRAYIK
ncbi:MAG: hypothetical protein SGPRY_002771, partial [Prymnesium sp.]